ncbi:hypothetical protein B0H16DRAFT_1686370 [Mycena metata]|uniref:Uncharacterized protein n=1 Tax=Mycena metata TaxID=1033252 RepID=A0AAD7JRL9_9AGAR|nr:hypothetical protein B0H16DRAFT_1686370 [Mycena metata]
MSSQFAIRRQDLAAVTAPFEVPFLATPSDLSGPRIFGLIDRKCQLYRRQIIDLPLVALNEQKSQIPRVAQLLAYQRTQAWNLPRPAPSAISSRVSWSSIPEFLYSCGKFWDTLDVRDLYNISGKASIKHEGGYVGMSLQLAPNPLGEYLSPLDYGTLLNFPHNFSPSLNPRNAGGRRSLFPFDDMTLMDVPHDTLPSLDPRNAGGVRSSCAHLRIITHRQSQSVSTFDDTTLPNIFHDALPFLDPRNAGEYYNPSSESVLVPLQRYLSPERPPQFRTLAEPTKRGRKTREDSQPPAVMPGKASKEDSKHLEGSPIVVVIRLHEAGWEEANFRRKGHSRLGK